MSAPRQLDLLDALAGREAALQQVTEHAGTWVDEALALFPQIPRDRPMTAEDINFALRRLGLREPHHHNAWGALASAAKRRHLIRWNGGRAPMRGSKSHGRMTDVYEFVDRSNGR